MVSSKADGRGAVQAETSCFAGGLLGGSQMLKFFSFLQNVLADRLSRDRGATAVEYGLIVALIAGAIIGTVALLGTTIAGWFDTLRAGL